MSPYNVSFYSIMFCVKHINIISFKHFVLHLTMASSSRHYCQNKPHSFCYICATYTFLHQKPNITSFVRHAYKAYFQVALGDQGGVSPERAFSFVLFPKLVSIRQANGAKSTSFN